MMTQLQNFKKNESAVWVRPRCTWTTKMVKLAVSCTLQSVQIQWIFCKYHEISWPDDKICKQLISQWERSSKGNPCNTDQMIWLFYGLIM